ALEHEHLASGAREIRCGGQAVVAAADDDGVVLHSWRGLMAARVTPGWKGPGQQEERRADSFGPAPPGRLQPAAAGFVAENPGVQEQVNAAIHSAGLYHGAGWPL